MNRLVCVVPGEFAYEEAEMPVWEPGTTILKITRIGICGTDLHAFEGTQPYFDYPRILGHELAGEIIQTDPDNGFEMGQIVTIIPYFNCGKCVACRNQKPNCCSNLKVFGVHMDGGMSEYITIPSYSLVDGKGMQADELALVEPLAIGAHGVRRAGVTANDTVLVVGAGPIGLGALEFARIAGAKTIALDINANRLDFCKTRLGVTDCVHGLTENVAERLNDITKGDMPTVIIDATGNLKAIQTAFQYMAHGGSYILIGLQKGDISFSHPEFHKREGTLMSSRNATRVDFDHVIRCMKDKLINPTNYITHRVSFEQVKDEFSKWLDPLNGVIKAMVSVN